jgi:hypothetical protein
LFQDLDEPSDVIQIADIRDVRDAGALAEEEPEFIPFSFVVEEAEAGCWSMFTDDQYTKVCRIFFFKRRGHTSYRARVYSCRHMIFFLLKDTLIAVLVHAAGLADSSPKTASTASSFFSRIPRFYGI